MSQSPKFSPVNKMGINDKMINKAWTGTKSTIASPIDRITYHNFSHTDCSGTCAGNAEAFFIKAFFL
jgi:hypothetical protein